MGTLLKFLLIVLVIYYALKFLFGFLFKSMNQGKKQDRFEDDRKEEGDVTVKYKDRENKNYRNDEGEYVDYEEVDDD